MPGTIGEPTELFRRLTFVRAECCRLYGELPLGSAHASALDAFMAACDDLINAVYDEDEEAERSLAA